MAFARYTPIILFPLFLMTRYLFMKLQGILWSLNGINETLKLSRKPQGYNISVHVQDIWLRCAFDDFTSGQKEDFITTHKSFTSPKSLLADNVSLYCINTTEAIFVKTDLSINVHDSNISGFMKIAQYKHATQLLCMPLPAFHKFAEELGDPEAQVLILSNTGRCGGTLVCQIFEATGEGLALSEPWAFADPCYKQQHYQKDEIQQIMCNIVRVLCKPYLKKYSCYIIKPSAVHIGLIPFVMKGLPQVKHLFMYRDTWTTVKSMFRTLFGSKWKRLMIGYLFKLESTPKLEMLEYSTRELIGPHGRQELEQTMDSMLAFSIGIVFSATAQYLNALNQGFPIQAFKYEDLLANSQYWVEYLYKFCDLPLHLVPKGLEAMSHDSQRHSSISRQITKTAEDLGSYTGKNKEIVEKMYKIFNIPESNELINLPGTITDIAK